MELFIYDSELALLGIVDEITSLIWTRRYWSCGEFSLLLPVTERHAELIRTGRYIMRKGDTEAGEISYISIRRDKNGLEQMEAQGRFLTHWIGNRIIEPYIVMTGSSHELLQTIVRDNLVSPMDVRRKVSNLGITDTGALVTENVNYASEQFANALEECTSRAQLAKIGFRIETNIATKSHAFVVYKGADRTSDQGINRPCIFSPDFDNILEQEFSRSTENVASAIYVGGPAVQDAPRKWTEVSDDTRTGLDRIEFFYDASDLAQTDSQDGVEYTIPDAEYAAMLHTRGEQTLARKIESISFTSRIDTHAGLTYRRDYDVGDRVTCVNRRWRVKIDARITEVVESYESGREELHVTFGESLPTLSEKIRGR